MSLPLHADLAGADSGVAQQMYGSVVVKANLTHNHSLPQSVFSSLPFTTNHLIPADLKVLGEELQGFRTASEINDYLIHIARRRKLPITWTERDIRNRYGMLRTHSHWRADTFLTLLLTDGRPHEHTVTVDGVIDTVVWLMDNGDTDLLLHATEICIFDNTFNTNSLGLKLGVFSTVDRFGCTRLVGCSLMLRETRDAFSCVLAAFQRISGITLTCLLTDGDLWLGEALSVTCPSCVHLLCTWHLAKCVLRNVRPAFGGHCDEWSEFMTRWWRITSKSDSNTVQDFDGEWHTLRQFLRDSVTDEEAPATIKALNYLGNPDRVGEGDSEDEGDLFGGSAAGGDPPEHDDAQDHDHEGDANGEEAEAPDHLNGGVRGAFAQEEPALQPEPTRDTGQHEHRQAAPQEGDTDTDNADGHAPNQNELQRHQVSFLTLPHSFPTRSHPSPRSAPLPHSFPKPHYIAG